MCLTSFEVTWLSKSNLWSANTARCQEAPRVDGTFGSLRNLFKIPDTHHKHKAGDPRAPDPAAHYETSHPTSRDADWLGSELAFPFHLDIYWLYPDLLLPHGLAAEFRPPESPRASGATRPHPCPGTAWSLSLSVSRNWKKCLFRLLLGRFFGCFIDNQV